MPLSARVVGGIFALLRAPRNSLGWHARREEAHHAAPDRHEGKTLNAVHTCRATPNNTAILV
jgi:hypothetical protein